MGWVETDTKGNVTVHAPAANTRGPIPPKAYLDNCLVGGLVQDDLDSAESDALYALIELSKEGRIDLVTSSVTRQEIELVPLEHRAPHRAVYAFLIELPTIEESELVPRILTAAPGLKGPLLLGHHDLGTLSRILPDWDDARHVFQAVQNGCAYLVTVDAKTILTHSDEVEAAFPILVMRPSELVAALAPRETS
jgi:hypothetical protein